MVAELIDGKALAEQRNTALAERIAQLPEGVKPCLVAVSVGADAGWDVYTKRQKKTAESLGISYRLDVLPSDASQTELSEHIETLNADQSVHGIIVQAPLPAHLQGDAVLAQLSPAKDIEGVTPANLGLVLTGRPAIAPCTALSAVELAKVVLPNLRGIDAVVIGASVIVGKPVAQLLLNEGATPTVCHIDTKDVAARTREADLIVIAVGVPGLLKPEMVKPGAVIVDVGINRVKGPDGKNKIVGDAAPEVMEVAGYVTPVPGGVGSLTTTILMEATVQAAENIGNMRPMLEGYSLVRALGDEGMDLSPETADKLALLLSRHMVSVPVGGSMRTPFQRRLDQGIVVMDGALGTELLARGIPADSLADAAIDQPDIVCAIHQDYLDVGAHILSTHTFSSNRIRAGSSSRAVAQVQAGVRLARQVARGKALVFGSIGPLGRLLGAEISEEEARKAYTEVAVAMADAGADGFLLETMTSTEEARVAAESVRAISSLPIVVCRVFRRDHGEEICAFVRALESVGVDAIGLNCASGLREVGAIVHRLAACSHLPIVARPNAGYPRRDDDGQLHYNLNPNYYASQAKSYVESGAALIGGCCGIGPKHISCMAEEVAHLRVVSIESETNICQPSENGTSVSDVNPVLERMQSADDFPVLALVSGRLTPAESRLASQSLVDGGAQCIGVLTGWPGCRELRVGARLRHIADVCQVPTVLEILAGERSVREIQDILLDAHLLGIRMVLIDVGVFPVSRYWNNEPLADAHHILSLIAKLNAGINARGNILDEATHFTVGVRLSSQTLKDAKHYAQAGAQFATVQPVYDHALFRTAMASYTADIPLLVDILVLPNAATAHEIDNEIPALSVPEKLKEVLENNPDQDIENVLKFIRHWRNRIAGVCLLLPDERTDAACAVLTGLK